MPARKLEDILIDFFESQQQTELTKGLALLALLWMADSNVTLEDVTLDQVKPGEM